MKVIPNDNLVPNVRDHYVKIRPYSDLIHNLILAEELIRGASQFFHLRRDAVLYSGYVREFGLGTPKLTPEETQGFTIRLWHKGEEVRSLTFPNLGYGGVLHCETIGDSFEEVVGWDMIGALARHKPAFLAANAT